MLKSPALVLAIAALAALASPRKAGAQQGGERGAGPDGTSSVPDYQAPIPPHEFAFTRAAYSGLRRGFWGPSAWATDFPKADRQFMVIAGELLPYLDAYRNEHPIRLDDPELRRYPFLYAVEVGYMRLSESEVLGLRSYLEAGGFLLVDDFWGSVEWAAFAEQMRRVFPDRAIEEVPPDHPVFDMAFEIDRVLQVPNVGQGRRGGPTWERDGITPRLRGIFDDDGRLMVAILWNTDFGDGWEWAEDPFYPHVYSRYAVQMGINLILYGMAY